MHQQVLTNEPNPEIKAFQADLKLKLRYLGSLFSIVLVIVGLYLLLNGLLAIVNSHNKTTAPSEAEIFQSLKTETTADATATPSEVIATPVPTCPSPSITPSVGVEGISTVRASGSALIKAEYTAKAIATTGDWRATDYVNGDLVKGQYTVKLGDTLWEISEAVYGNGNDWHKILNANKNTINKLPNGQQALIIPGQILELP